MHLSHAEVGFRDFLQSLFAVTCHSSWSAMQAILPILALSFYFTDGGNNNDDNGGDGGDGDDDVGRVAEALILLVVGRYSIQVSRMCRVFYLDYLYHDIPLVEENNQRLHDTMTNNGDDNHRQLRTTMMNTYNEECNNQLNDVKQSDD
jgi:hypothetical protein